MKSFQIKVNGKFADYSQGHDVNLEDFSKFLVTKNYLEEKLWKERRHVVGVIRKNSTKYFVKLATSEGMSATSRNEYLWNEKFNKLNPRENSNYWVPENVESGKFKNLFYMITEYFEGNLLAEKPNPGYEIPNLSNYLDDMINFTELIQKLDIKNLEEDEQFENTSHFDRQLIKTKMWLEDIPKEIVDKYKLYELFELIKNSNLKSAVRHGDFTPWHIFKLKNNKFLLIDGEHALSNSVEYYDISYLIQRIYSVLENKTLALELINKLKKKGYDFEKLKIVLSRRAIGGFLDRSLHEKPDYGLDIDFKNLVLNL